MAAPRVRAAPATPIRRSWSATTHAELVSATAATASIAGTGESEAQWKASNASAVPTPMTTRVRRTDQSPRRPPSQVPTIETRP